MPTEKFPNGSLTTLNGAIDNSITSIIVTDATSFPSNGNFRILIDSEIMLVTTVSGTTFTVTRGVEGTTAASHADLTPVNGVFTAGSWNQFRSDTFLKIPYVSLPVAGEAGRVVHTEILKFVDNGSNWNARIPAYQLKFPILGDYSWVNQGPATAMNTYGPTYLQMPAGSWSGGITALVKSAPATPYSIILGFMTDALCFNADLGFILRKSSTGEIITDGIQYQSGSFFKILAKWNSTVFFNSVYAGLTMPQKSIWWSKFRDDGTNRNFYYSCDGQNWVLFSSHSRTDFITADQCGIYFDVAAQVVATGVTFFNWVEGG